MQLHIDKLPLVPLVQIFSYIDDFSDKIALERACYHWSPEIWEQIWKTTKTCPVPLNNRETVGLVLNRCGKWLEELWLRNMPIDGYLVNEIYKRMKCLKHLKLSKCQLSGPGPTANFITNVFGHQLCSFILDGTAYDTNLRGLIEHNSSKLEHLSLNLIISHGILPTKLPSSLKSFSLRTRNDFYFHSLNFLMNMARDCINLKILYLEIHTLGPDMLEAIGTIKSLVYLNLAVNSIPDELTLQNVICHELPRLKALHIGGSCSEETMFGIFQARPDLVHFNLHTFNTLQAFQIPNSLNSLAFHSTGNSSFSINDEFGRFFLRTLLFQNNKSIQHLDIRSFVLPSPGYLSKLFGQFPNLKTIHCKMLPSFNILDLKIFFYMLEKLLGNGRNFTIYFHFGDQNREYCKYSLPDDLAQFKKAGWWRRRLKEREGKCENLVLKKLIKDAVDGGNNPSFLDEYWME